MAVVVVVVAAVLGASVLSNLAACGLSLAPRSVRPPDEMPARLGVGLRLTCEAARVEGKNETEDNKAANNFLVGNLW